jgi:hypothetical protein
LFGLWSTQFLTAALTSPANPDDSEGEVSSESEEEDNTDDNAAPEAMPLGNIWEKNQDFCAPHPNPEDSFREYYTVASRSQKLVSGLVCNPIDVNSPIRAWREVFKRTILDKIVNYTNEYGQLNAKDWQNITRQDLESFIAVLFLMGVQKRKDKPANWFSDNPYLETCGIPLCSIGSGKVVEDCFSEAHRSKQVLKMVKLKYAKMQEKQTSGTRKINKYYLSH